MVIQKAHELGEAISQSEEYAKLMYAQDALELDYDGLANMNLLQQQQKKLADIMSHPSTTQEDIKALSDEVDVLQTKLLSDEVFMEYLNAQQAFQKLIADVIKTLADYMAINNLVSTDVCGHGGCNGHCGSCGGSN